jgi:6-pyruvoyltetrahydropterin/6-carboxytetrahydropterin synthase
MKYQSTKTYGHDLGLSCCFRQWKAKSHCNKLHGYSLSFKFVFEAETLDDRDWVQDFGGLRDLKEGLFETFDHKLVIADDDPEKALFLQMYRERVADIKILDGVGCERFAEHAYNLANKLLKAAWIKEYTASGFVDKQRVRVVSCECAEHAGNSAIYYGDN